MDKDLDIKSLQDENGRLKTICSVKTDIVSVSAHQIRTSLSALKWVIKMFLDEDLGKLNIEQENLMRKAYEINERAINKTSELLLTNKSESIAEKKPFFSCIFDFFGEAHARGIEIIFLTPGKKPAGVRADKEQLRIVLQNLIENAIKYNNRNGKIFVSVKEDGDMVETSIKDTGMGISEEGKKKIFEKFYRDPEAEKKETMGSGIGLFDTKKIIEEHGGKIWFESQKDDGTTFFFTIPIFR
jgi:signal transduction histidine kinase